MNRKNTRLYVWIKTQRKYRNLQRRLVSQQGEISARFLRKMELLEKRLFDLNRKWKLGISTAALMGWMAATPTMAQKTFPAVIKISELTATDGFVIEGENNSDNFGYDIQNAGDINNDGIDDIVIGAPRADANNLFNSGKASVIFGRNDGFSTPFDASMLDGTNGFVINGLEGDDLGSRVAASTYSFLGGTVCAAGDINGDGIDDLMVNAPRMDYYRGKSYIIFGKETTFSASFDLTGLDGTNGFSISGESTGEDFGLSADKAGDINGDGIDDLIMGARGVDAPAGSNSGRAYVVFGSKSGFSATFNLSGLDGSNGFKIDGKAVSDRLGVVSGAGDINGDGIGDLVIGAPSATVGENTNAGKSFTIFGKKESFGSSFDLSDLDGSNGFTINGSAASNFISDISRAGDINGDGVDDFMISAHQADPNEKGNAGESYIVFGKKEAFASSLDLSGLDGSTGFTIQGSDTYDYSGHTVSDIGDINGDGFDDVIIASYYTGKNHVIFGKDEAFTSPMSLADIDGTNGFVIESTNSAGNAVGRSGDFNGDGAPDILIGNRLANSSTGEAYVVYGTKNNTPTVASTIADLTLEEGFSTKTVDLSETFSDADEDALTLTAVSSDEVVVKVAIDGTTLTLTEAGNGTATITITADDKGFNGKVIDEFSVEVKAAILGIQDSDFNKLSLYPNPTTSGNITIQIGEIITGLIEVRDITGKKITQQQVLRSDRATVDLSYETNGSYFISIKATDQKSAQLRVLKQ